MMTITIALPRPEIEHLPPRIFTWLLAAQVGGAFLTETKLIPGIPNNVGVFEVTGVLFVLMAALYFWKHNRPVQTHPIIVLLAVIVVLAAVSQAQVSYTQQVFAAINLLIILFMLVFVVVMYNVVLLSQEHFLAVLQFFSWAALVAGLWIIAESALGGGTYDAAGPFRNRAAAGISMLTSFWVVLCYALWPGVPRRQRYLLYATLLIILYCIAIAGRRSVYVSLICGVAALLGGSALTSGRSVLRVTGVLALVLGAVIGLYQFAEDISPAAVFFKDRIEMIDDRLEMAAGTGDDGEDNFIVNQRQGVFHAVADHPLTGIGWGGFYESPYSPTGHEVHSTPLRFLAELGIPGFIVYVLLMGRLLWGVTRLWRDHRATLFRLPALVLCAALWGLTTSYAYNRHITERTFWILLVIIIAAEKIMREELRIRN